MPRRLKRALNGTYLERSGGGVRCASGQSGAAQVNEGLVLAPRKVVGGGGREEEGTRFVRAGFFRMKRTRKNVSSSKLSSIMASWHHTTACCTRYGTTAHPTRCYNWYMPVRVAHSSCRRSLHRCIAANTAAAAAAAAVAATVVSTLPSLSSPGTTSRIER